MHLKDYFADKPRGAKASMAESLGISRTWMALLIAKRRLPSPELAIAIAAYTSNDVTRQELRPDLWGK